MKRIKCMLALAAGITAISPPLSATNGDNLIAVGPVSRSMGGVGIALPMDAISAVFQNPASMCYGTFCPSSEVNFAGTLFVPTIKTRITNPDGTFAAKSKSTIYPIPAIGISVPFGKNPQQWRFGFAAYGVSGMGVNYKGTAVDAPGAFVTPGGAFPLVAGKYTNLSVMKFSPSVAYMVNQKLSVGLGAQASYGMLDLGMGTASGFGFGVQPGLIYKATDKLTFGISYITPQGINHERVNDFDGDGTMDDLKLSSPNNLGLGIAYEFLDRRLIAELNTRWINWSDADGYSDFDWRDQWTLGLGFRYAVIREKYFVSAGYNYGASPVKEHSNWAPGFTNVQGKNIPNYYYETFRITGFPAVVEHHLTFGMTYQFTDKFGASVAYMHAFENEIVESGTDLFGRPSTITSDLRENGFDFSLNWKF
jgi:long-chain fatty acid transport protein